MATQANLIATYNSNPSLQNQYTQQQYLDLFDFGLPAATPTPTPTPTSTPAPTSGVAGIINQNINQYQSGGNDKYTGFGDFGNLDESTAKTEYRDVSDGKGGSYIKEFTTYLDPGGLRRTIDGKFVTHAGLEVEPIAVSIANAVMGKEKYKGEYPEEGKTLGTFSNRIDTNAYGVPFTDLSIIQKIKMDMSRNKELKQYAEELKKQKELKAQIEREAIARAKGQIRLGSNLTQDTTYKSDPRDSQIGRQKYTGKGQAFEQKTPTNKRYNSPRKDGGLMYADGGRVYLYNRLK